VTTHMETWNSALAQHGYWILVATIFLETVGLPVPAALALLIAGGAAARGFLLVPYALSGALFAMLTGDTLMYMLGRATGWWILGVLCRISLNPESCILRSADSFYRRGRALLVIAKFIPGINTMAPPLAGSMNMRFAPFLRLDLAGSLLYIGSWFGVGFAFSGALDVLARGYVAAGRIFALLVIALLVGYMGFVAWLWIKGRTLSAVVFANPADAARELLAGAYVYDVRSHGYFDAKATRIRGSRRLNPNALHQPQAEFAGEGTIYVYCTCARQATSARVARELQKVFQDRGVRVVVIRGGLRAWAKAGLPVEVVPSEEMEALPAFD
jgi:membrane protein DedA with SNARE-associated domain/rhodanese-related sulfurtransferase